MCRSGFIKLLTKEVKSSIISTFVSMCRSGFIKLLTKEVKSHVGVGLFLALFLLLLLGLLSGTAGSGATSGSTTSSWSGTDATANVGDKFGNVAAFESAGKESWPEGLD